MSEREFIYFSWLLSFTFAVSGLSLKNVMIVEFCKEIILNCLILSLNCRESQKSEVKSVESEVYLSHFDE